MDAHFFALCRQLCSVERGWSEGAAKKECAPDLDGNVERGGIGARAGAGSAGLG